VVEICVVNRVHYTLIFCIIVLMLVDVMLCKNRHCAVISAATVDGEFQATIQYNTIKLY